MTDRDDGGKEEAYRDLYNPDGHYPENPRCKCPVCFGRKYAAGEPVEMHAYQKRLLQYMADHPTGRLNVIQQPRVALDWKAAEEFYRKWREAYPGLAIAADRMTSQYAPDYEGIEHRIVADMIIDDPYLRDIGPLIIDGINDGIKKGANLALMYGRNPHGTRREKRRARKARNKGGR